MTPSIHLQRRVSGHARRASTPWTLPALLPTLIPSLLPALLVGCNDGATVVRGTGAVIQERRDLKPLSRIRLSGGIDLSVQVVGIGPLPESSGAETIVWIEGAQNIIEYVESTVVGSTLQLEFRDGVRLDPRPSIEVRIGRLEALDAAGSGEVVVEGIGAGPRPPATLDVEIAGSVDVRASGEVDRLTVRQLGSGTLNLQGLRARELDHVSVGSGDVSVFVTESVTTRIEGSGDMSLYGPATKVVETIDGSGEIRRHDSKPDAAPAVNPVDDP